MYLQIIYDEKEIPSEWIPLETQDRIETKPQGRYKVITRERTLPLCEYAGQVALGVLSISLTAGLILCDKDSWSLFHKKKTREFWLPLDRKIIPSSRQSIPDSNIPITSPFLQLSPNQTTTRLHTNTQPKESKLLIRKPDETILFPETEQQLLKMYWTRLQKELQLTCILRSKLAKKVEEKKNIARSAQINSPKGTYSALIIENYFNNGKMEESEKAIKNELDILLITRMKFENSYNFNSRDIPFGDSYLQRIKCAYQDIAKLEYELMHTDGNHSNQMIPS